MVGLTELEDIFIKYNLWLPLKIMLILIVTRIIAVCVKKVFRNKHTAEANMLIKRFITNIVIATVYLIGILTAIGQIPQLNSTFKTLLAGSGILALGISLSAQESLSNIVSGIMIVIFRPFEIGDRITIVSNNLTGTIEDITLRHTVVKTFINSRVVIPNSVISKEIIENSNLIDSRASSFIDVQISYESDIDKAIEIISSIIANHPYYIDTREDQSDPQMVKVFIRGFAESGIDLRSSMWTRTVNENFEACSDIRYQIIKQFSKNGIEIPYNKVEIVSKN